MSHTRTVLSSEPVPIHCLPGKNAIEQTGSCGLQSMCEEKETQQRRTVCPENPRISGKFCGSEPIPIEDISQYLMVPSLLPLINPLPSGVNSIHLTPALCPHHLATSLCVRESHIQSELSKFPPAIYRPSGRNATELNQRALLVTGITCDEPSLKFHIRTVASSDPETRERPLGEKAMPLIGTVGSLNMALIRF